MEHIYEIPGESQSTTTPTNPHFKQALSRLLEAHNTLHATQAGILDFQLTMAHRAAAVCEDLEQRLLTEQDSAAHLALCEQLNTMYAGIVGILFGMVPAVQDNEGNETDD